MLSGDRDVRDPDLAVVAPSDLDRRVLLARDQVEPPLVPVLMLVAYALEENVRLVGLGDGHHLHVFVLESDDLGKRGFANLTLEFGEVVALDDSFDFLLDLAIYPCFKTTNVDQPAASLAVAGRYKGVRLSLLATKTNLAAILSLLDGLVSFFYMLLYLEDPVGLVKVVGVPDGLGGRLVL